jgi:hypothetical protein
MAPLDPGNQQVAAHAPRPSPSSEPTVMQSLPAGNMPNEPTGCIRCLPVGRNPLGFAAGLLSDGLQ